MKKMTTANIIKKIYGTSIKHILNVANGQMPEYVESFLKNLANDDALWRVKDIKSQLIHEVWGCGKSESSGDIVIFYSDSKGQEIDTDISKKIDETSEALKNTAAKIEDVMWFCNDLCLALENIDISDKKKSVSSSVLKYASITAKIHTSVLQQIIDIILQESVKLERLKVKEK